MHLCVLYLKSEKLYITKKIVTISFPSTFHNFAKESIEVVYGLLDLVVSKKVIIKIVLNFTDITFLDTL